MSGTVWQPHPGNNCPATESRGYLGWPGCKTHCEVHSMYWVFGRSRLDGHSKVGLRKEHLPTKECASALPSKLGSGRLNLALGTFQQKDWCNLRHPRSTFQMRSESRVWLLPSGGWSESKSSYCLCQQHNRENKRDGVPGCSQGMCCYNRL